MDMSATEIALGRPRMVAFLLLKSIAEFPRTPKSERRCGILPPQATTIFPINFLRAEGFHLDSFFRVDGLANEQARKHTVPAVFDRGDGLLSAANGFQEILQSQCRAVELSLIGLADALLFL